MNDRYDHDASLDADDTIIPNDGKPNSDRPINQP